MPLLSCFTATGGLLAMSSKPSLAEQIYDSLANQYRDSGISIEPGSRTDCTMFAQAMGMARAQLAQEKGWNQILPTRVSDLLDQREAEYGLVPGPQDTTDQRRAALAARKLLPGGASRNNVENALRALLGADFIAYRPTKHSEALLTPPSSAGQPINFQLASTPAKLVTIGRDISLIGGGPQAVPYSKVEIPVHPGLSPAAHYIAAGDKLVVDPGLPASEEVVIVTASATNSFTAMFNKPHQSGALCTTQPWPHWSSTQRNSLIVVSAAAAVDPTKRKAVNDLMGRIARSVSTWAIVATTGAGTAGPFVIGSSPLGATPLGTVAYP